LISCGNPTLLKGSISAGKRGVYHSLQGYARISKSCIFVLSRAMTLLETDVAKCKNCEADVVETYCSNCGQRKIGRLNARYILTLLQNDLLDFDRGLLYTFTQLWKHPGRTVHSYIQGQTKRYYSPLKYLIFWGAIALLIMQVNVSRSNAEKSVQELIYNDHAFLSDESFTDLALLYSVSLRDYLNLYYIFLVPFVTLVSYVTYYRKKYNFVELMVMYLYLSGQIVFTIAFLAIIALGVGAEYTLYLMYALGPVILYLIVKCHKEFFNENWVPTILKSLFVFYLGQILLFVAAYLTVQGIKLA
jgi:hypothetical protein